MRSGATLWGEQIWQVQGLCYIWTHWLFPCELLKHSWFQIKQIRASVPCCPETVQAKDKVYGAQHVHHSPPKMRGACASPHQSGLIQIVIICSQLKQPGNSYYHTPENQMPFQSYMYWNNLHCQSLLLASFPPFIFRKIIFTIYFSV